MGSCTFQKLTEKKLEVQTLLDEQDAVMDGRDGARLLAINVDTGEVEHQLRIESLPSWDDMAGANGALFLSTLDRKLICFSE